MYNKKEVGERLKLFRKNAKITQTSISEQLNIPQSTYSKYELGKMDVNMEALEIIQKLHNLNLNWLLLGAGEMYLTDSGNNKITNGNNSHIQIGEGNTIAISDYKEALHEKDIEIARLRGQVEILERLLNNKSNG